MHEALLGDVCDAADVAGDNRLDGDGVVSMVSWSVEDLQQGVERGARGALDGRIVNKVHDAKASLSISCCQEEETRTGIRAECLGAHSSSSHSHWQLTAIRLAFLTEALESWNPDDGPDFIHEGVMYWLHPSTQNPGERTSPRR